MKARVEFLCENRPEQNLKAGTGSTESNCCMLGSGDQSLLYVNRIRKLRPTFTAFTTAAVGLRVLVLVLVLSH